MKKLFIFNLALLGTVGIGIAFASPQAFADWSGDCYFTGGQCRVDGNGDYGANDVLPGRDDADGPNALAGVNNKGDLIDEIDRRLKGSAHAQEGARFIMKETTGTTNFQDFKDLINQGNVSLDKASVYISRSSWRADNKLDFFYASGYPKENRNVVRILQNGKVKSIIEIACGNMAGNPVVIEPPDSTIRPHTELRPTSGGKFSPGQSIVAKTWVTKDGPDTRSDWQRVVWYDQDGDGKNNDGQGNVIVEGSNTRSYATATNVIKEDPVVINGSKNRICVKLNLSNPRKNVKNGDTRIVGDPATDCRGINKSTVSENDPTGSISVRCNNPATSQQRITYSFNDPDGVATGRITSTAGYSASNLAETGSATAYHQPDAGGKTYTLTVTNPKAAGGFGTSKTFSATSPSCSPGAMNEISPDVELSSSVIEPGQPLTATAEVECNPGTSTSTSNYRRIFWYENGGNVSRFDNPSDVLVSPAPNDESSPPVAAKTYCTASNPFAPWGPITIPPTGVTRVCTSLQLTNPSANATISGSGIAVDCANVATRYFFRVRLGDVNALGCLASCASTPGISAFNSGSGTSYRGSGSQVGVFSVDPVTEFTSSSNPSAFTVASGNPRRLTFANDGAGYGGNFTQRYQIPDYWAGATTSAPQTVGTSSSNVITSGDVFVNGNSAVSSVGVGNVPGLRWVIAKNIYILGSLPVLDGVYIAKENIYTCASGFSATPRSQMAAQCATTLTVRGSLIAGGSVKLQRTAGSLSTTPAEIIEYNPFVWIQGVNPTSPLPTSTSGKLDFITTLPPIL